MTKKEGYTLDVHISALVPMLKAKDLPETITFYTTILGFAVQSRADSDDGSPYWCCLKLDGAMVMFYSMDAPKGPPTMTGVLYFYPKDVKALWDDLKDRAAVEWDLQVMDYGMLEFAIRDCNGYTLSFGQSAKETSN